jgi:hypothetical protein
MKSGLAHGDAGYRPQGTAPPGRPAAVHRYWQASFVTAGPGAPRPRRRARPQRRLLPDSPARSMATWHSGTPRLRGMQD